MQQDHAVRLPRAIYERLSADVVGLPRTVETFRNILKHEQLFLNLPKPGATAGLVLKHATAVFRSLHSRREPMSYKFGYTHCPVFRWCNRKFGYQFAVQKYDRMDVLYVASDPIGPGFLEAALIQQFMGHVIEAFYCFVLWEFINSYTPLKCLCFGAYIAPSQLSIHSKIDRRQSWLPQ